MTTFRWQVEDADESHPRVDTQTVRSEPGVLAASLTPTLEAAPV
jgi:hypothetical protein